MSVHIIIPVFNRLSLTRSIIACLRKQVLDQPLNILIVNDGSTDGSTEWLAKQKDIEVLEGNGSLFWGGAVELAFSHLMVKAKSDDWVLLMNNDTSVAEDFVQRLLDVAKANAPAAVGSLVRDEKDHARILSIGVRLDAWRLSISDMLNGFSPKKIHNSVLEVDALSGRGVLFPIASIKAAGGMRSCFLPHYLADYELSLRVKKSGWRLLISPSISVYSDDDFGSNRQNLSLLDKLFSVRSPIYLPAILVFWWEASNYLQRFTLLLRLPFYFCLRHTYKNKK